MKVKSPLKSSQRKSDICNIVGIITNRNNQNFFCNILKNAQKETKEVKIAVAYTNDYYLKMVIDFCRNQEIYLSFFGRKEVKKREDAFKNKFEKKNDPPISNSSLESLIQEKPKVVKKVNLIKNLHSKVYWFLEYGVYIGSANLQPTAWNYNIECGVWFSSKEQNYSIKIKPELEDFFKRLEGLEGEYKEAG